MKVVIVDYGLGNINSIANMLKRIGVDAVHSNSHDDIKNADKLILPGVGAFNHGMKSLQEFNLINILNEEVLVHKKPILGICLGMQLLLNGSEEGDLPGLGWIQGASVRFRFNDNSLNLKVPHMGWNVVKSTGIIDETPEQRFYFVHSYHAICEDAANVIGITQHGYDFPSVIRSNHILGAQFHPEKSHKFGMNFLKSFVESKL